MNFPSVETNLVHTFKPIDESTLTKEQKEILSVTEITYHAVLCSITPNNHCELCSFYVPNSNPPNPAYQHRSMPDTSIEKCPSCGRTCTKVFLKPDDPELRRVPDEHNTHFAIHSDDVFSQPDPIIPRAKYDREAYMEFAKNLRESWKKMAHSQPKPPSYANAKTKTNKKSKEDSGPIMVDRKKKFKKIAKEVSDSESTISQTPIKTIKRKVRV